jgi:hypothetical protein
MPDKAMMLTAAEVDILKRLRAAERVDTIAWYDDHAWKMLICVAPTGRHSITTANNKRAGRPPMSKPELERLVYRSRMLPS